MTISGTHVLRFDFSVKLDVAKLNSMSPAQVKALSDGIGMILAANVLVDRNDEETDVRR